MTGQRLKCCLYQASDCAEDPNNPYRNLAVEEFFVQYLSERASDDMAILYLWQNADCVVFGRNQNPSNECRLDVMEELGVLPVRRKTGGGAVFHDLQNLNFSFIVPQRYYDRDVSMQIVVRALHSCGIDAEVNGRNDITAGGRKVSGNAYLSKGGVCLHHGTLLIAADTQKMERLLTVDAQKFAGKGVRSVKSRVKNLSEIMPMLAAEDYGNAIKRSFLECYAGDKHADFVSLGLDKSDMERILQLQEEYASREWIFGHEMRQEWQRCRRFGWGSCIVRYSGASYTVYSDTLYAEAFERVSAIVHGQDFAERASELSDALQREMYRDICALIQESVENDV